MNDKPFEVRKNDRDYQINDILWLKEFDPDKQEYTGNECRRRVTYILHGGDFGIEKGYCVMGLSPEP